MKAIIKATHPIRGYVVITDDGREIKCKDANEAMEIKLKLEREAKASKEEEKKDGCK